MPICQCNPHTGLPRSSGCTAQGRSSPPKPSCHDEARTLSAISPRNRYHCLYRRTGHLTRTPRKCNCLGLIRTIPPRKWNFLRQSAPAHMDFSVASPQPGSGQLISCHIVRHREAVDLWHECCRDCQESPRDGVFLRGGGGKILKHAGREQANLQWEPGLDNGQSNQSPEGSAEAFLALGVGFQDCWNICTQSATATEISTTLTAPSPQWKQIF
jgi:hypothetical protein